MTRDRILNHRLRNMMSGHGIGIEFLVLASFLICVFLMGGSSRADVSSLVILRPLAVLVSAWAWIRLSDETRRRWRGLLLFAMMLFLLPAFQLIPLPASIWRALPGRDLVGTISAAIGAESAARPLSLSPVDTWNALFSLFVPLAVLLLSIGLSEMEHRRLLLVVIGLGFLSALVGVLQALAPGSIALHFYRFDSASEANGLFANRNHQALLLACLLPMIATLLLLSVRRQPLRIGIIGASILLLLPLLLVTGSRAGLVVGILGILSLLTLMPPARRDRQKRLSWLADPRLTIAGGALAIAGAIFLSRRAEAFQRLFASTPGEETRVLVWNPIVHAIGDLFPFGSGIGSFVVTYQVYEPYGLLSPNYMNHAHNEYLEIAMTGGVAAMILLAAVIAIWARFTWRWLRSPLRGPGVVTGRLGSIILLLFAISSLVDYPARVPTMACVLTLAAVWMLGGGFQPPLPRARLAP